MALSGSCVAKATSQDNLIFSWGAVQDIAANVSRVSWQLRLDAGQYGRIDAGPGSPWTVTVAGKTFSGTADLTIGNNETKVLASGQVEVSHSPSGTAGFQFSFTQEFWINFDGVYITTVSGSGNATLDTIARASAPTARLSAELGKTLTIYTNRVSDSFTHTLQYRFGNASGVIGTGVGDSCAWTPDPELARQIPNGVSGTAVISCATYAGSTPIGTKEVTVVLTVPASVIPTAKASWEDTSGAYGKVGTLVQGISALEITVSGTGTYGSSIVASDVTLQGKPYSGGVLTQSGKLPLAFSVTDSRGRSGGDTEYLTVAAYSQPSLSLSASRCTDDGTADDAGGCAKITVSGFVTQVNGSNSASLTVSWGGNSQRLENLVGNISWQKIVPADADTTMAISADLTDRLASARRSMTLSTGYATLDFLAGGKGIAFGKAATREGFECAMPAFFTGPVSGVAPGGYGLGGTAVSYTDLDDATDCGWWAFDSTTENRPFDYGMGMTVNRYGVRAVQIACNPHMDGCGEICLRSKTTDGWTPWEYLDPPVKYGAEYRTTERHNGKTVYAYLANCGALPNATSKSVSTAIPSGARIVSAVGIAVQSGGASEPMPCIAYNGSVICSFFVTAGKNISINAFADMSDYTGYITVKYTKD